MCLPWESFENTAGKGEIARNEQFLLFPQCFLLCQRTIHYFHEIQNCRLQTFSLEESKICRLGKCLSLLTLAKCIGRHLRTGSCWFDPQLSQYFFQGLMIIIVTGFIPLSPLSVVLRIVMWKSRQQFGKNIFRSTG